ncbi:VOC family protein [Raoultella terrigena]|uniref:VOC family protein n=1 Tax=Raoultella terrigena TaxID=577 RepID=UPI002DC01600|nr:VOC family protein [Raoultella terrigena]MEB8193197.1 VOC family protein [Raoultella terrigena]
MTTLKWDHAVQFVNQPDEAIATFAGHKLNALAGGRHPGWGTWNALSYFGLTYIEFLAIYDRAELASAQADFLLSRDAAQLLPENQALHRVALRTDDIDQTHAELRSKGLNVSPIVDGQRNDPQGNIISWRIFTVDGDFNGLPYPFILQWGEGDDARLTRLRAQGLDGPHPAGEVILQSAVFAVQDPQAARAHWHVLFGFNELPEGLAVGQQRFVFLQGQDNRLVELVFNVSDPALKGQRFRVGNGEYRFQ